MNDPEDLKDRIKQTLRRQLEAGRNYKGFKQQWLANQLGVHVTAYNKWEKGINQPNAIDLAQIAKLENLDLTFYFAPDMAPKEADLEIKKYIPPLAQMEQYVGALERRAAAAEESDPVANNLREKTVLYEIVDLIDHEDPFTLERIKSGLLGMLALMKSPAPPYKGEERRTASGT